MPDQSDKPQRSKEDKLVEKLMKTLNKQNDSDYVFDLVDNPKHLDKYVKSLQDLSDQLQEININNPYALTVKARLVPLIGNWNEITADIFIRNIEQAIESISEEDKETLWEWLKDDFMTNKERVLAHKPDLQEKISKINMLFEM